MQSQRVLLVSHTARPEAIEATMLAGQMCVTAGAQVVMPAADIADFAAYLPAGEITALEDIGTCELDVALVLGGDGTILRAAELVRGAECPIAGVNLGHVGFLAELEHQDLEGAVQQVLAGQFTVEERNTLKVELYDGEQLLLQTFAVNEATVEKNQRMIEVAIGVDNLPLTGFGCDGVVIATATGSTAYAFSAGGPVMWPGVAATLVVPLAAHALFNRPLVLGPEQVAEVRLLAANKSEATLWCDGRRRFQVLPGQRVVVQQSAKKLRLARLHSGIFTDRLVNKFNLPVTGWRETVRHDR